MSKFTMIVADKISDSNLINSNILEDEHAFYSEFQTYQKFERVIFDHAIYESQIDNNLNFQPDLNPLKRAGAGNSDIWIEDDSSAF